MAFLERINILYRLDTLAFDLATRQRRSFFEYYLISLLLLTVATSLRSSSWTFRLHSTLSIVYIDGMSTTVVSDSRISTARTRGCLHTSSVVIRVFVIVVPLPNQTQWSVPQASALSPILFLLYTAELQAVIKQHVLSPHFFDDDSQICGFCRPGEVGTLLQHLIDCIDDVAL